MISPLKRLLASGTAFDYAIFVHCGSNRGVCTIVSMDHSEAEQYFERLSRSQMKKACMGKMQAFHRT
jgi:hypothetical protein